MMWYWRPVRKDIGVILQDQTPYGRGALQNPLPVLGANDVGRITLRVSFDDEIGVDRVIVQKNLAGMAGAVWISATLKEAWITNDAGLQITPFADISSLDYQAQQLDLITIIATRNGAGTLTDFVMENARGTQVTLATDVNMQPQWQNVGPSTPASQRSGFTVWSVDVAFPGANRSYPVNENTGTISAPTGGGDTITWSNFQWIGGEVGVGAKTIMPGRTVNHKYVRGTVIADRVF